MRVLLYIFAIILLIGWILGALVINAGSLVHILLMLAGVSLALSAMRRGTVN